MTPMRPDILFIMTDQQRFDTIAALGNSRIYTPNLDRLVRRGITFSNAYATCPVCVAARYTIRTGCEAATTRVFSNAKADPAAGQAREMETRCGPYLARVMSRLGYRTFGIGKFHTYPWDEDVGYETLWRSEETYHPPAREGDDYGSWLAREHPEFDFLEQPMGERSEMYYLPQRSPLPAELGAEWWVADRAIEEIAKSDDERPFFGFISFMGPHPPLAPPIPFNRMYNPERMPELVLGNIEEDHLDEEIPYMGYAVWADAVNPELAKIVKARYYGEITYLDHCLGRIVDAIEARPRSDNILVCFFSDHGDLLGDHHGWQKQNFFEAACRVPFLLSWPAILPAGTVRNQLVSLADLFGIATHTAGACELRQGMNIIKMLQGECAPRAYLTGMVEVPGSQDFKVMVVTDEWKYIFMANGGREQLFNRRRDPNELSNCINSSPGIRDDLYVLAVKLCRTPGATNALDGDKLRAFPFRKRTPKRIYQFDRSHGVVAFPDKPEDALEDFDRATLRRVK
jgi:arylsulfatase A-like enzyme